jgi:hypothetical protein
MLALCVATEVVRAMPARAEEPDAAGAARSHGRGYVPRLRLI